MGHAGDAKRPTATIRSVTPALCGLQHGGDCMLLSSTYKWSEYEPPRRPNHSTVIPVSPAELLRLTPTTDLRPNSKAAVKIVPDCTTTTSSASPPISFCASADPPPLVSHISYRSSHLLYVSSLSMHYLYSFLLPNRARRSAHVALCSSRLSLSATRSFPGPEALACVTSCRTQLF
ncbi:hypothetical protein PENSPDRAFT_392587 [Peniophora sp. CONT]|nr:hypothetical protein PENSPDRAFT_392587 [Peniophora sp. CONT]